MPSRQLLERISDKWVVLILCAPGVGIGPTAALDAPQAMRYSEISPA
ncbi:hypothetical protein ABLG96_15400 [Nakamurella sp. A5-74]|uniref:Uncharacterized protein n=1 Tax=Nakamurella sp. A5-74 TaxID=3158264 RepID=A0AAU8DK52_9ACTN